MRLLVSGGGTGGHVYPVLAVVKELLNLENECADLLYLGRHESIEERLSSRAGIPFQSIKVAGIRGLSPWTAVRNLIQLLNSIKTVRSVMSVFRPDVIFCTGGYVSAPVIWAGAIERIPRVIYLPDLEPGWSVRATASWASCVAVSFREVAQYFAKGKARVTGYPVRREFFQVDRARARAKFQLEATAWTVTILGGSRGARTINQAVVNNLNGLTSLAQVIHITGPEDEEWVKSSVQKMPGVRGSRVKVFGYLDEELPEALAAADVVVARAGAATLGEFPALGLPAVLVPYPYAGRHQERNVEFLTSRGAAIRLDNSTLERELVPNLKGLFDEPERLKTMASAARALSVPAAARNIAELLRGYAGASA